MRFGHGSDVTHLTAPWNEDAALPVAEDLVGSTAPSRAHSLGEEGIPDISGF